MQIASKRLIALTAGLATAITGLLVAPSASAGPLMPGAAEQAAAIPSSAMPTAGLNVSFNPNDKESVRRAYQNIFLNTADLKIGWKGTVKPCKAGTFSAAWKNGAIKSINFFRRYASLPPLTEAKGTTHAQESALMMQATRKQMNAYNIGDPGWVCASTKAQTLPTKDGAGNLFIGGLIHSYNKADGYKGPGDAMTTFISEYNLRAAFLDEQAKTVSIGETNTEKNGVYGALFTFGDPNIIPKRQVAWPPAGFVPFELVKKQENSWSETRWTVDKPGFPSYPAPTVKVTKNGTAVKVSGITSYSGIKFELPAEVLNAPPKDIRAVDTYRVTITGSGQKIQYDVKVFIADALWPKEKADGTLRAPVQQIVLSPDMNRNGFGEILAVDAGGELLRFGFDAVNKLAKPVSLGVGWGQIKVYAPGDWDGDGKSDVLGVDTNGKLFLYRGDGKGGIASGRQIGQGWGGFRVIPAGDLTGDRKNDLLAIKESTGELFLYANDGRGGFKYPYPKVGYGWKGFELYASGDVTKDGKADILSIDGKGDLYMYAGRGNGTFAKKIKVGNGWKGYQLAAGADLNKNRMADIVSRADNGVLYFYPAKGGGMFGKKIQLATGW
ncbi:MAG: VCBS repeat-containing protein [Micrococcales bacterium]|nr:VCBS repeat-containing protein [Micrococcales bacterium]